MAFTRFSRRSVLDPLSRAAGADIYVRSESELRNALGTVARTGQPARIVIASDIVVTATIDLSVVHSGVIFACGGASRVRSAISDPLFLYTAVSDDERPQIAFEQFRAQGTGETEATSYGPFAFFKIAEDSVTVQGFTFRGCEVRSSGFFIAGDGYAGGVNVSYLIISDSLIKSRADADGGHVIDAYCYDSTISDCIVYSSGEGNESIRMGGPRNQIVGGTLWGGDITWSTDNGAIVGVNNLNSITISASTNRVLGCRLATVVIDSSAADCAVVGNFIDTSVTTTSSSGGNSITGNTGGATLTLHGSDVSAGNV